MREDPFGKRALFEMPAVDIPDEGEGRDAAFTHSSPLTSVMIECSSCGAATRVRFTEALRRVAGFTVWLPGLRFNRWLTCPSCGKRSWCRVRWLG